MEVKRDRLSTEINQKLKEALSDSLEVTTENKRNSVASPNQSIDTQIINEDEKDRQKNDIKVRKQTYKIKKKNVVKEFSSALRDKSCTILSSSIKIRGTLKSWAKYWCVVKPELVIIYKSTKQRHWVGTILINNCEFFERPSSKEGFCFKIFNPYGETIWATKGPNGELAAALVQPMPKDHLILRADNEHTGKCWLDALEVAQQSSLVTSNKIHSDLYGGDENNLLSQGADSFTSQYTDTHEENDKSDDSSLEEVADEEAFIACATEQTPIQETTYSNLVDNEEFGESGETAEEMEEENKSILWALLKQVRPGMDLSKVTLPTFILEPRSFLEKLSDYYYHSNFLAMAANDENPYSRMKEVVRWYLSGFYKKPKGLKKPYNPIIGEMFRCMWKDEKSSSRTFFIAEQVSHHPPVSAFYCSNRKDGYTIGGSILARSKFYGNSTSAILDGIAKLRLLNRGEEYTVNMPYAHVKGILIGSLTAEYGGIVQIKCEKTGYVAEIEFKLKPFWKKSGECNYVSGKIRMGNSVLAKIEGKWDSEIFIYEYSSNQSNEETKPKLFFSPTPEMKQSRLKCYNVALAEQEVYESEKLWLKVSEAIKNADQTAATREKLVLEDEQRRIHKELHENNKEWVPRYFERDIESMNEYSWVYKYRDLRAWDPDNDLLQFEYQGILRTQTIRQVAIVKNAVSLSKSALPASSNKYLPLIKEPEGSCSGGSRRTSLGTTHSCESPQLTEQITKLVEMVLQLSNDHKETHKNLHLLRLEVNNFQKQFKSKSFFNFKDIVLVFLLFISSYIFSKLL
ncbi:oxysterol-binding protein-related protein 8 isoform X1 [Hydra vulgaris]|uniref:oxysterol-binding protein-related protein 8 isoform X1 n=1 Tax=Hydra vulgaris TaxID=6087 RepID=UPI000640E360|nr:oxysterol-binding protein-related protein 8-like isoform X1 [Hydra vulgaris]